MLPVWFGLVWVGLGWLKYGPALDSTGVHIYMPGYFRFEHVGLVKILEEGSEVEYLR